MEEEGDGAKKRNINELVNYIQGSRVEIPRYAANKIKNYIDVFKKRKRLNDRIRASAAVRPGSNNKQDTENEPTDTMVRENMSEDEDDRPRSRRPPTDACRCRRKRRRPTGCPCVRRKRKKSKCRSRRRSKSRCRRRRSKGRGRSKKRKRRRC